MESVYDIKQLNHEMVKDISRDNVDVRFVRHSLNGMVFGVLVVDID
jgi:hypothetical protein